MYALCHTTGIQITVVIFEHIKQSCVLELNPVTVMVKLFVQILNISVGLKDWNASTAMNVPPTPG